MTTKIINHYCLKKHNTLGFSVYAQFFADCKSIQDISKALDYAKKNKLIILPLGGGSNLVFTKDFAGLVMLIDLSGIEVDQYQEEVYVTAQAGESWHEFVLWTIGQGFYGLENLSLIPGNVGAAPIQNIGAYGVELKDRFHSLTAINISTGESRSFSADDCHFAYRDSVFKHGLKNKYIITDVTFRLSLTPEFVLDYGGLSLLKNHIELTPEKVSEEVIRIRQSKLPNPNLIGNVGSFFKNPVISIDDSNELLKRYPGIVTYLAEDKVKVAAGWMIDKCGLKGYRLGDVGVHDEQALVLVNYGEGSGHLLMQLAEKIQYRIRADFGIDLEIEPQIY